jgi:hypothetical protein
MTTAFIIIAIWAPLVLLGAACGLLIKLVARLYAKADVSLLWSFASVVIANGASIALVFLAKWICDEAGFAWTITSKASGILSLAGGLLGSWTFVALLRDRATGARLGLKRAALPVAAAYAVAAAITLAAAKAWG